MGFKKNVKNKPKPILESFINRLRNRVALKRTQNLNTNIKDYHQYLHNKNTILSTDVPLKFECERLELIKQVYTIYLNI